MKELGDKNILLKRNNGITLIALIVTIIVLLILAGVGVSTLKGDNGIIKKTASTKKDSRDAEIEEEVYVDVSASKINKDAEVDENKLRNWLTKSFGEEGTDFALEGDEIEGWTITIKENKSSYFVDVDGEIKKIEYEEPINNSDSLILGFVDNLGTRAMIYLYANPDKCTKGETVTITDSQGNTLTNVDEEEQTTVKAVAKNREGKIEITGKDYQDAKQYYIAYPVTQNGTYTFKATKAGVTTPTITTIRVKKIETFTAIEDIQSLDYYNSEKKAYNYKGVAVPKGYYVDTKSSVNTGLVITDEIDSKGYSIGNEWVWVPVNSTVGNNDFYVISSGKVKGADEEPNPVIYSKYGKLYSFSSARTRNLYGSSSFYPYGSSRGILGTPSGTTGYREPAILTDPNYGDQDYITLIAKRDGTGYFGEDDIKALATQYVTDYSNMVTSVEKYGGFYIGRYELANISGIVKEQPGTTYTQENWYSYYNKCLTFGKAINQDNTTVQITESSMVYGCLWDAMMQWLSFKYDVGYTGYNYSGYGNYLSEAIIVSNKATSITVKPIDTGKILETGQTSYTISNNIYDLSGNCRDWTQEADNNRDRIMRGSYFYYDREGFNYSSSRQGGNTSYSSDQVSSRPQLYIK